MRFETGPVQLHWLSGFIIPLEPLLCSSSLFLMTGVNLQEEEQSLVQLLWFL